MNRKRFIAVIFLDEEKAYEGAQALQKLHDDGAVTVYADVIVQREANGTLSTRGERSAAR